MRSIKNIKNSSLFIYTIFLSFLLISNTFAQDIKLITEKSFNVSDGELLDLRTDVGDVTISTWIQDKISIKIFGNKNAEKKIEFTFDETDFGLRVIGEKYGSGFLNWFRKISLKYEIVLPQKFNIELKTAGGDLIVKELIGEFDMKTSGGDIILIKSSGELNCSTSGGDIEVQDFSGDCDASTSGGDIIMNIFEGDVIANTSGGDIEINSQSGKINAKTSGGDVDVNYGGINEGIKLGTSGGDIKLTVRPGFKADVELKTSGGKVYNNFSNNYGKKVTKYKFIGTYNSGGEVLVAKTSGGNITVTEK